MIVPQHALDAYPPVGADAWKAKDDSTVVPLAQLMRSLASRADTIREDPVATKELLDASRQLTESLKRPDEVVADFALMPCSYGFVRLAIEMGVFEQLAAAKQPLTPAALATACNLPDSQLVLRVARTLVSLGFAIDAETETGKAAFAANAVTRQMTLPCARAGTIFYFDQIFPIIANTAPFFRKNGFRTPQGDERGVFQYTYDIDYTGYKYWFKDPEVCANFNIFMQGYFGAPKLSYPTDWLPFDKACLDGFDASKGEYVWVDIGGGKGHHPQEIVEKYPECKGKFILQDQAEVLNTHESDFVLSPRIEKMPHNFFEPQPVKGARIYCIENVLHNWSDADCLKILRQTRPALTPGYSKLIIGGVVIADTNASSIHSSLDAAMFLLFKGAQRSKQQWIDLLASAGFTVTKVWVPPPHATDNTVIEAELTA